MIKLNDELQIIKENYKEIAEWECRDNGKPICEAEADVLSCVDTFQYYAGTCKLSCIYIRKFTAASTILSNPISSLLFPYFASIVFAA